MTTLKEHIAFLQTLKIPYKGTLIGYLKHVFEKHDLGSDLMGDATGDTIGDVTKAMPFREFVRACLQEPEGRVKFADTPAPLPLVQKAHETAQTA
jgi:hypothetical protein